MLVDAGNNVVRVGAGTGSLNANGTTVAGIVVDYVLDIDKGAADGTAFGIGSVEYILDALSETLINNDFNPTNDNAFTCGSFARSWLEVNAYDFWNWSDKSKKKNIQDMNYGLAEIMKLRPVSYQWKENKVGTFTVPEDKIETNLGFIAQEVDAVVPELVRNEAWQANSETPGDYKLVEGGYQMNYDGMIPVLVKAMQEQQAQIEALKKEIEELKKK